MYILFLDLLEIRLRELYDVVDKFLILESDHTFTGMEKPMVLKDYFESKGSFKKYVTFKDQKGKMSHRGRGPKKCHVLFEWPSKVLHRSSCCN